MELVFILTLSHLNEGDSTGDKVSLKKREAITTESGTTILFHEDNPNGNFLHLQEKSV